MLATFPFLSEEASFSDKLQVSGKTTTISHDSFKNSQVYAIWTLQLVNFHSSRSSRISSLVTSIGLSFSSRKTCQYE